MILKVATTLSETIDAWRLVYQQYVKSALIDANPFSVFTYPEYLSRNSAVILGKVGDKSVCSVSAVLDSNHYLPLDTYFHEELDGLRKKNKKLIEIGLLANQSEKASPFYMIELLSSIAHFGVYSNFHDYVIGVHPRRVKFFKHFFGFNQVGTNKKYHQLNDAEVVLLHADGQDFETLAQKASHAVYFEETDLKFANRFRFIWLASLLPFQFVLCCISAFVRIWQRFFSIGAGNEKQEVTVIANDKDPINQEEKEGSVTGESTTFNFQSVEAMDLDNNLHSGKEKEEVILRTLQHAFNLSKEEAESMVEGEHFNHPY